MRWRLEVVRGSLPRTAFVNPVRTISLCDLAEPALAETVSLTGRPICEARRFTSTPNLLTNSLSTAFAGTSTTWFGIGDLPADGQPLELLHRDGDCILVEHHLHGMTGARLSGFWVDDDCQIVPKGDEVRLPTDGWLRFLEE